MKKYTNAENERMHGSLERHRKDRIAYGEYFGTIYAVFGELRQ